MLGKKIYIFDDIVDIKCQENIKNILLGETLYRKKRFPWYFIEDVTAAGDDDSQHRPAMGHVFIDYDHDSPPDKAKSIVESDFHEMVLPILESSCRKMSVNNIGLLQGRSFLQLPLNIKDRSVDRPHRDMYETNNFFVVLYYVCDSDGDTIIYNETGSSDKYTLKQKITPKQGRVAIFDGCLYHTAEQPLNNVRCVINYNLGLRY